MRITIGQKPGSSFSDPLGLLNDCHRRIEHFLNLLILVANEAKGRILNRDQKEALESSLRYFREAGPKHKEDEEKSLFPRMRQKKVPEIDEVITVLQQLEVDHEEMDKNHITIDSLFSKWLLDGSLPKDEFSMIKDKLKKLQEIYKRHIFIEETNIFTLARKVIDPSEIKLIGEEMMVRRGIHFNKFNLPIDPEARGK